MAAFYTAMILVAVLTTQVCAAQQAPAQDSAPDKQDQLLQSGEAVLDQAEIDGQGGTVKVKVLIDAPAEVIWNVIVQCAHAMRYLEGMEECEIIFDNDSETLTRHVVDSGWLGPTIDYQFRTLKDPYHRLDVDLREGNLDKLEGYWQFDKYGEQVLLTHLLTIKPRIPAPRWFVRRKLKKQLPGMMVCIRALSGGSFSEEGRQSDLDKCPGKSVARKESPD